VLYTIVALTFLPLCLLVRLPKAKPAQGAAS
jgi:hypothetical protein